MHDMLYSEKDHKTSFKNELKPSLQDCLVTAGSPYCQMMDYH